MRTALVRVPEDLAEMLGWLSRATGRRTSEILDQLARDKVVAMFEANAQVIELLKALRKRTP